MTPSHHDIPDERTCGYCHRRVLDTEEHNCPGMVRWRERRLDHLALAQPSRPKAGRLAPTTTTSPTTSPQKKGTTK